MIPTSTPCPAWLAGRLGGSPGAAVDLTSGDVLYGTTGDLVATCTLDLLDLPTRAAVLLALHDEGTARGKSWSRPWMLGGIWSPLDDFQAARCVVAAIVAVEAGREPPVGVLGPWQARGAIRDHVRDLLTGSVEGRALAYDDAGEELPFTLSGWLAIRWTDGQRAPRSGPETGEAGRLAADAAARDLGLLLVGVDL